MKILGIIAEYNPFHMGHAWQIESSKKTSQCDAVMVLMSGSLTQRGDFAVLNKWERTRLALSAGVDLVCELPFGYACQSAEAFAHGGIKIFNATGVIDVLSFGSEFGQIRPLTNLAEILVHEPAEFKSFLKQELSSGVSFPRARELAIRSYLGHETGQLLKTPNNILALEYLKALHKTQSDIDAMTVKRQGADYHSLLPSKYLSATGIRTILNDALTHPESASAILEALDNKLPYSADDLILPFKKNYNPRGDDYFLNALRLQILSNDVKHLKNTPYVSEGLEHKIRDALKTATNLDECVNAIISKRIPQTRVRRILCNRLLELDKETLNLFQAESFVPYLRVLGFNETGQAILKAIKDQGQLPILTSLKKSRFLLTPTQNKMLRYDCRATDLHNQFYETVYCYHRDYRQSPVQYPKQEIPVLAKSPK
ncbi:nucleotidyltransferase [Acetobacterium sp.]|jgi:predicted nucleotidyltransferase|uniref:nucleotidyltransferase n=1 Tax=Acetobacterium sp. TaxID=1872094 RepID=UPI00271A2CED|nr:nucleotidyltransferase [Acetobacterium sp.]MDO9491650.1 nucleotidyltransferase [Acetobacterium sp.]